MEPLPTSMSALRYHGNKDLRLERVPVPVPGISDVVVRVEFCAICQTDVEEFLHGPIYIQHESDGNGATNKITGAGIPMTVGHEIVGTVVSRGKAVNDLSPGDRVVFTMYACGDCWYCDPRNGGNVSQCDSWVVAGFMADGGLAEFMKFAQQGVVKVPANVGERAGLALCEPCAVATRATRRGRLQAGETVAILGAGAIGLLLLQVCKAKGCRVIMIDMREMSLQLARELGADATVDASAEDVTEAVRELCMGSFSNRP
jgi:(R,R)-butanediol dehydrogenase/meso-butanediol dehydrogenase/diacetyl reductase